MDYVCAKCKEPFDHGIKNPVITPKHESYIQRYGPFAGQILSYLGMIANRGKTIYNLKQKIINLERDLKAAQP